jgi:hypothetical protein
MSLGELQISFPLFFVPKLHLMTSCGNFDSEKIYHNEVFYYKDTLHFFFLNDPNITHTKKYIWG